jgi:hypothetical protein
VTETSYATPLVASATRPWLRWIGAAAGVLLGLVLLYSAWGKALDPHGTGEIYARRGLLPASLAGLVVMSAVAVEAALGLALLFNLRRSPLLALATLMMTAFFALTAWEYVHPPADGSGCGCFGNLISRTPGQAALQDGFFVVLALLAWLGRPARVAPRRWAVPAAGFVVAFAFAALAPRFVGDDTATRLAPGVKVASLRLDEIVPEAQRGTSLVLLIDRGDATTKAAVPRINELLVLKNGPCGVFALAEPNAELATSFTWEAGPAFDVREAPYSLLKPLYRTLPRAFLVTDGVVVRTWTGLPGDAELAALAEGRTP